MQGLVRGPVERIQFVGAPFDIDLGSHKDELIPEQHLAFLDLRGEKIGVDGAGVNVEQGHVVVEHLMQQDDELHQVGVGLLPEGFLALAEEVIQQGRDAVGQGVGFQVVV